jgi:superfamily II DNA or RNA helicase
MNLGTWSKARGIEVASYALDAKFEGSTVRRQFFEAKNLAREKARRMGMWGWQKQPEFVKHWRGGTPLGLDRVPFGVAYDRDGKGWGKKINVESAGRFENIPDFIGELRPEQVGAMEKLTRDPVGLAHFSTGTGKGVMIPWLVATLKYRTLVVVPSVQLLDEMVQRFETHLGIKPQKYGGSGMGKRYAAAAHPDVAIITIQSLSLRASGTPDWVKSWDMVLVDECDKSVTTEDRLETLWTLRPLRFYGFTGTLSLNGTENKVLPLWFGPVTELRPHNIIPSCLRVHTNFRSFIDLDKESQFTLLNNEICEDTDRNLAVVASVKEGMATLETKKSLVLTNRVEHAKFLAGMLEASGIHSVTMLGEDGKDDRQAAKDEVTNWEGPVVLVGSTQILGRGFDLPALQEVHVCYPNRFDSNVIQMVGRVLRKHPGKTFARVVDYVDHLVPILASQSKGRLRSMKKEYGKGFTFADIIR